MPLVRQATAQLVTDAALTLGEAVGSAAREETLKWLLASLALPVVNSVRHRTRRLPPWARMLALALLLLGVYAARNAYLEAQTAALGEGVRAQPRRATPAARALAESDDPSGPLVAARRFLRQQPVRRVLVAVAVVVALDLSNVAIAIDRADLFAGPLLRCGRALARLLGPAVRTAWRAIRASARAITAFRAAMSQHASC
jgi:hypothetical protein